jgi:hypothetical protein
MGLHNVTLEARPASLAFSFLLTSPEIAGIFRIFAIGVKDGE